MSLCTYCRCRVAVTPDDDACDFCAITQEEAEAEYLRFLYRDEPGEVRVNI